jgi:hypothetical protein
MIRGKFNVPGWVINAFLMALSWDFGAAADRELKLSSAKRQMRWMKKRMGMHVENNE